MMLRMFRTPPSLCAVHDGPLQALHGAPPDEVNIICSMVLLINQSGVNTLPTYRRMRRIIAFRIRILPVIVRDLLLRVAEGVGPDEGPFPIVLVGYSEQLDVVCLYRERGGYSICLVLR